MVFTYKAANRLADITPAYLAAVERAPGNAELLHGLFAAYVRCAGRAGGCRALQALLAAGAPARWARLRAATAGRQRRCVPLRGRTQGSRARRCTPPPAQVPRPPFPSLAPTGTPTL